MTSDYPWIHFGGELLNWMAASESLALPVDAIEYAGMLLLMNVLYGMKEFNWLRRTVNILQNREAFYEHVKPQNTSIMTSNMSVRDELRKLTKMERAVLHRYMYPGTTRGFECTRVYPGVPGYKKEVLHNVLL